MNNNPIFKKINSGQNTSEHSEEFDLEEYLNYCEKHPVEEKSEGEEESGEISTKKLKKNEDEEDEIITSKDIKNKKSSKK